MRKGRYIGGGIVILLFAVWALREEYYLSNDFIAGSLFFNRSEAIAIVWGVERGYHGSTFGLWVATMMTALGRPWTEDDRYETTVVVKSTGIAIEKAGLPESPRRLGVVLGDIVGDFGALGIKKLDPDSMKLVDPTSAQRTAFANVGKAEEHDEASGNGWSWRLQMFDWGDTVTAAERAPHFVKMTLHGIPVTLRLESTLTRKAVLVQGAEETEMVAEDHIHRVTAAEYYDIFPRTP